MTCGGSELTLTVSDIWATPRPGTFCTMGVISPPSVATATEMSTLATDWATSPSLMALTLGQRCNKEASLHRRLKSLFTAVSLTHPSPNQSSEMLSLSLTPLLTAVSLTAQNSPKRLVEVLVQISKASQGMI